MMMNLVMGEVNHHLGNGRVLKTADVYIEHHLNDPKWGNVEMLFTPAGEVDDSYYTVSVDGAVIDKIDTSRMSATAFASATIEGLWRDHVSDPFIL